MPHAWYRRPAPSPVREGNADWRPRGVHAPPAFGPHVCVPRQAQVRARATAAFGPRARVPRLAGTLLLGALLLAAAACSRRPSAGGAPITPPAVDAWPTYGGDYTSSGVERTASVGRAGRRRPPAVLQGATLRPLWTFRADGAVTGEPVAQDDRLYFGTWADSVYCVNLRTGRRVWRVSFARSHGMGAYGPFPRIHGGPLLAGGRVYVAQSGGHVIALDADSGAVIWRSQPLYPGSVRDVLRSSPRIDRGVLYVGVGGLGDVLDERGMVAALDARTGRLRWETDLVRYRGGDAAVYGTPALLPSAGLLFVTTGNPVGGPSPDGDPYSDSIVALHLADGRIAWAWQAHANDAQDRDFIAGPNLFRLAGGEILVGAGAKDGFYYALDARSGRLVWERNLALRGYATMVFSTGIAQGGRVFVGTEDLSRRLRAWPPQYQPPAKGRLVALDGATGRVLWQARMGAAMPVPGALVDGVLVTVDSQGGLAVLDPADGETWWRGRAAGVLTNASAGVSAVGDTVLIPLARPGGVQAFRLTRS